MTPSATSVELLSDAIPIEEFERPRNATMMNPVTMIA